MKPFEILLIYNFVSFVIIAMGLILCKKVIRKESVKNIVLKSISILVVMIHVSSLYLDFFTNGGQASVEDNIILPIYPCNVIMWLLVITAFIKDKSSKIFSHLAEFTFIVGTVCGVIGVVFNFNFLNTPSFKDYDILKGLLSHSVMIFGTIYLYVMGYVKLTVINTMKSILYGLLLFVAIGFSINTLFKVFNIESVNSMYLETPPISGFEIINFYTIGIVGLIISFIGLNLYEYFKYNEEDRWLYQKIKERNRL